MLISSYWLLSEQNILLCKLPGLTKSGSLSKATMNSGPYQTRPSSQSKYWYNYTLLAITRWIKLPILQKQEINLLFRLYLEMIVSW